MCRASLVKDFRDFTNRFQSMNDAKNAIREMIMCEATKKKICEANHIEARFNLRYSSHTAIDER
jgi:hypothetical protein